MNHLTCICCGKPLTGGLDTYGDLGQEMCWDALGCFDSIDSIAYYTAAQPELALHNARIANGVPPTKLGVIPLDNQVHIMI